MRIKSVVYYLLVTWDDDPNGCRWPRVPWYDPSKWPCAGQPSTRPKTTEANLTNPRSRIRYTAPARLPHLPIRQQRNYWYVFVRVQAEEPFPGQADLYSRLSIKGQRVIFIINTRSLGTSFSTPNPCSFLLLFVVGTALGLVNSLLVTRPIYHCSGRDRDLSRKRRRGLDVSQSAPHQSHFHMAPKGICRSNYTRIVRCRADHQRS